MCKGTNGIGLGRLEGTHVGQCSSPGLAEAWRIREENAIGNQKGPGASSLEKSDVLSKTQPAQDDSLGRELDNNALPSLWSPLVQMVHSISLLWSTPSLWSPQGLPLGGNQRESRGHGIDRSAFWGKGQDWTGNLRQMAFINKLHFGICLLYQLFYHNYYSL